MLYFFNPISLKRSSKYSPAVMSENFFGCTESIHDSKLVRSISDLGCKKKGTEKREVFINSLGGFTTRCVVETNLPLVKRCNISPTLTTMSSCPAFIGYHSPV